MVDVFFDRKLFFFFVSLFRLLSLQRKRNVRITIINNKRISCDTQHKVQSNDKNAFKNIVKKMFR